MKSTTIAQVEKKLQSMIKKYGLEKKITVEKIKKWIYSSGTNARDASNTFLAKCLQVFPEFDDIDKMNGMLQVLSDAWNYFPHKSLGGKSPKDMVGSKMKATDKNNMNQGSMPKMVVGDVEMEWDAYLEMIKQMEKEQEPFKHWVKNDVLPKYKKYLGQTIKGKKKQEDAYRVADIFFDRVFLVGFVHLDSIRPEFVQKEFPSWWPTHVMGDNLKPVQVKASLKVLFSFLTLVFGVDSKEFGF